MKKTLTLILGLLLFIVGLSAKTLKVYSVVGKVSKKSGNSWVSLSKNQSVGETERVKINASSTLKLLDEGGRMVYTFSSPGEYKLSDLLKASDTENKNLMSKITADAKKQIGASGTKTNKQVGASERGDDFISYNFTDSLYTAVCEELASGADTGGLSACKVAGREDGMFYPRFTNNSVIPLYINIFVKGAETPWSPVLIFTDDDESALMVAPGETVDLDFISIMEMPGDSFVAVGFEEPFNGYELAAMFKRGDKPDADKVEGVNISFFR